MQAIAVVSSVIACEGVRINLNRVTISGRPSKLSVRRLPDWLAFAAVCTFVFSGRPTELNFRGSITTNWFCQRRSRRS
jgi:hypothetical protein